MIGRLLKRRKSPAGFDPALDGVGVYALPQTYCETTQTGISVEDGCLVCRMYEALPDHAFPDQRVFVGPGRDAAPAPRRTMRIPIYALSEALRPWGWRLTPIEEEDVHEL